MGGIWSCEAANAVRLLIRWIGGSQLPLEHALPSSVKLRRIEQLLGKDGIEMGVHVMVDALDRQVGLRTLYEPQLITGLDHPGPQHSQVPAGAQRLYGALAEAGKLDFTLLLDARVSAGALICTWAVPAV